MPIRVLMVEDARADAELAVRELKRAGLAAEHRIVETEAGFLSELAGFTPDVILSDFSMPAFDGMRALEIARDSYPEIPFIFVSGTLGEEYAIRALKNGATDYVLKTNLQRLPASIERALQEAREREHNRRIERLLRENEAGLRRAQHLAGLAHVITGPDGAFESWSDTLPRLIGLDAAAMPGSTREWLDLVDAEDREAIRDRMVEAGRTGERVEIEYRLRRGDGRWIRLRQVSESLDPPGAVGEQRWFGTLQDVTEQRRAEEEQRSMRQLLDNIVDNIPTAVQLKSVADDYRVVMWNKAAEAVYGVPREDAVGRNVHDLWPKADADRFHAADLEVIASGRMQEFPERAAQTKHRGEIRVHMRKVALFDAAARATHLLVIADDITDQLADQNRLRESEERHRAMFEQAAVGIVHSTLDGRVLMFNQKFCLISGYSRDEAAALTIRELTHPDDIDRSLHGRARMLTDSAVPYEREVRLVCKDRTQLWVHITTSLVRAADETPSYFISVVHDISERKRAEHVLQQFRMAMDVTADSIYLTDPSTMRFVYLNQTACERLGYTREELLQKGPLDVLPLDAEQLRREYQDVIAAGDRGMRHERPYVRSDGSEGWTDLHRRALRTEGGTLIVTVGRDISERRALEERNSAIVKALGEITYDWRPPTNKLFWTGDYTRRLGYSAEEMGDDTDSWTSRVHPDDLDKVMAEVESSTRERRIYDLEYRFRHRDGGYIWMHDRGVPFVNSDGQLWRIIGVFSGIGERKEAEARIRRLNRVHAVLSGIDALIVRVRDRNELFREACRIPVEVGGFPMAWMGTVDSESKRLRPVAWHGTGPDYTDYIGAMRLGIDDSVPEGRGLAGRAVRERKPVIANDIAHDPRITMKTEAAAHGFRSLVILPLLIAEQVVGTIALYVGEAGFFDEDEMHLLQGLAGDIAFALDSLDKADRLKIEAVERRRVEEHLRDSEIRFRQTFELAASGMAHVALDGRFLRVNQRLCQMLGYTEGELIGRSVKDISHPEDRNVTDARRARVWSGELKSSGFEKRYLRKDGSVIWVSLTVALARDSAGNPEYEISVLEDITATKVAQRKIERLTRVYAVLSGINAAIVRIRDRNALFQEACRIVIDAGGLALTYICVVDRAQQQLIPVASAGVEDGFLEMVQNRHSLRDDAPEGHGPAARAVRERRAVVVNNVATDPQIRHKEVHAKRGIRSVAIMPLLVAGEPVGALGMHASEVGFFDEEEMKLLNELAGDIAYALDHIEKANKLDYLAYYDPLTGLANRNLFHERLSQHLHAARQARGKLALVLANVERFKAVNDSLGRQAGDELLKQIAGRLGEASDAADLARIGGDHFAIVLSEIKGRSEISRTVAGIWRDCFTQPFSVNGTELRIAARAGIALYPSDGADAEALFASAEAALQKAQQTGDRFFFHTRELTAGTADQLALENRLRQALEKEEFVLHYQPKVDLETRRIVGVEALIRWQNPELGLVPPGRFIPLMEETGLILEAGTWALRRAAMDHRAWVQQGLPAPRVAVNVSSVQLRQRDFVAAVEQAILEGIAPTGIDLEITESQVMEDIKANIEKLKAVRGLGVRLAIDDFGTGYSSLSYLAKLPVQTLKIDRSFIITMLNEPDTMTLVQTMISLAHSLRLKVVAEGVETEEQAKMLRLLRCDEMQGYLFSRPVPFEQFSALLAAKIA